MSKKLAWKWEHDYLPPKMGIYKCERNVVKLMCYEPNVKCCPNEKLITIDGVEYEVKNKFNLVNPPSYGDPMWIEFQGRKLYINKSKRIEHCLIEDLARDINRVIGFIKRNQ